MTSHADALEQPSHAQEAGAQDRLGEHNADEAADTLDSLPPTPSHTDMGTSPKGRRVSFLIPEDSPVFDDDDDDHDNGADAELHDTTDPDPERIPSDSTVSAYSTSSQWNASRRNSSVMSFQCPFRERTNSMLSVRSTNWIRSIGSGFDWYGRFKENNYYLKMRGKNKDEKRLRRAAAAKRLCQKLLDRKRNRSEDL